MPAAALSTKEQIVLAAERLIADHRVDGVSMRQIGAAVGSCLSSRTWLGGSSSPDARICA